MSDTLLDIDNAMRIQKMQMAWAKYRVFIIGFILAALIATAAGMFWYKQMNQAYLNQSAQLLTVLRDEAGNDNTVRDLDALSKTADLPLKAIVSLYHAQKLEQKNDLKAAQAVYASLMQETTLPPALGNLARVHYARIGVINGDDPAILHTTLDPITRTPQTAFYATGTELKAILLLREGKVDEANKIFTELSTDSTIPGTLRQRAKSMIRYE